MPEPGLDISPIPDNPTDKDIQDAFSLLINPLQEFPFVSQTTRPTWIGLAFTPILRPLLRGPYQMGVITATNPSTGKTLLANMLMTLHGGVQRGEMRR